jgi:predicted O-linked N-acetylglucosamine transferase (SPINDLY family)
MADDTTGNLSMKNWLRKIAQRPAPTPPDEETLGDWLREGFDHQASGDLDKAQAVYRKILDFSPSRASALYFLGVIAKDDGREDEAIDLLQKAAEARPNDAEIRFALGGVYFDQDRYLAAAEAFAAGLELQPHFSDMRANLSVSLIEAWRIEDGVAELERLRAEGYDSPQLQNCFGRVYRDCGRIDEAAAEFRKALLADPDHYNPWDNLLLTLNYSQRVAPPELYAEHRRYGTKFAKPYDAPIAQPLGGRRLRVGYVSPDFRHHVVSCFFESILANHDRERFEVFCYYNHRIEDQVTDRLRSAAEHWLDCVHYSDDQLAKRIREDGVDILIDLAGHTADNRLAVFAMKAAPLQASYLGYPNTTGLAAIDYRFTDARADPPGESDRFSTEQLVRLPNSYFCYRPPDDCPEVGGLPALANGYITFGCFNNFPKISEQFLEAAARILLRVGGARLVLKAKPLTLAEVAARVRDKFAACGVDPARLDLRGWTPKSVNHLTVYGEVDIALDSFPYNGATTTCEALWMGVPVVSVIGNRHSARVGSSLLHAVGLDDLLAETVEGYVEAAVRLASDPDRLAALRAGMRQRMSASPLMDGPGFTRRLESSYLELWQRKLDEQRGGSGDAREATPALLREAAAHRAAGRILEAEEAYKGVLRRQPDDAEALTALSDMAYEAGEPGAAIDWLSRGVSRNPRNASLHYLLGCTLQGEGKLMDAMASFGKAIELEPQMAKAHSNLGCTLEAAGELSGALQCYHRAIGIDPTLAVAHYNLGNACRQAGDERQAIEHFRRALALEPRHADWQCNLGIALHQRLLLDEAESALRHCLELDPRSARGHAALGATLVALGRAAEAEASLCAAIDCDAELVEVHSDLLLALHYRHGNDAQRLFDSHVAWNRAHHKRVGRSDARSRQELAASGRRRLNIAYLSADFARHPVAHFIEAVLAAHDRESFNIFGYSVVAFPDAVTERMKALCTHWRDVSRADELWIVNRMVADQIDILVDLSGHTAGGRPGLLMRKPAPVQVTWLGYPDTTGLREVDYRLTDAYADPVAQTDRFHTEKLVRLEHGFLCYRPPEDSPQPGTVPSLSSGRVTFGCFNNLAKLTPEMIALWSRLLGRVPGSRLMLKAYGLSAASARHDFAARFAAHGVGPAQLVLNAPEPLHAGHLAKYNEVDVALDVFPYHGATTTCEALWMGVPVVTLAGTTHVSRVGASILNRAGLGDLVARSPEEYLETACALASDVGRRGLLRKGLRDRLTRSPLLDAVVFTRGVEAAYREMWSAHVSAQVGRSADSGELQASGDSRIAVDPD